MLKNILNLDGAQQLGKNEQKAIIGGKAPVPVGLICCEWTTRCGETFCSHFDTICVIIEEVEL